MSAKPYSLVCIAIALVSHACAQERLAGKNQYPEARSVSGLSGGASAIRPDGTPAIDGALTLSTPIGYTLGGNRAVLMGANTSASASPRWFDGDVATNGSNGTAAMLFGANLTQMRLAVSVVQTSRLNEDRVFNVQLSPKTRLGRFGLSVGAQDLFDQTTTTPDYHHSSQSFFGASTYDAGNGVFLTAGAGTARFGRGFASASGPLLGAKAMIEHDGFGWNYGLGFTPGTIKMLGGDDVETSFFIGSCQGRYMTWSISLQF